jgi:hypothetical protein
MCELNQKALSGVEIAWFTPLESEVPVGEIWGPHGGEDMDVDLYGLRWSRIPPKRLYLSTSSRGVTSQMTNIVICLIDTWNTVLSGSPVTTTWHFFRLRMEETNSRYGG